MNVILVPVGESEWRTEGRLLGRAELSLTQSGERQAADWGQQFAGREVSKVLHSPDELATRTAEIIASSLGLSAKEVDDLAEVDFGLWTGLTDEQLEGRFESAHRQLLEAPLSVTPPNGEKFLVATERVRTRLLKLTKRAAGQTVVLVLRPMIFALTCWLIERGDAATLWQDARTVAEPKTYAPLDATAVKNAIGGE